MTTPITPKRLAELKAMPHDHNNSYAVINREDFEGLLAAAEERDALDKLVYVLERKLHAAELRLAMREDVAKLQGTLTKGDR